MPQAPENSSTPGLDALLTMAKRDPATLLATAEAHLSRAEAGCGSCGCGLPERAPEAATPTPFQAGRIAALLVPEGHALLDRGCPFPVGPDYDAWTRGFFAQLDRGLVLPPDGGPAYGGG